MTSSAAPGVLRRTIGSNGPGLSQISYGTMRLRGSTAEASDHLLALHDRGITTHHSSHEYDSHELYLSALDHMGADRKRFEHIVKLSSPSFDGTRFDPAAITEAVHTQLTALGVDQLASVQWLVRTPNAQDLAGRLAVVEQQSDAIRSCFEKLIATGDIGNVSIFNYHPDFALPAMDCVPNPAICDYLNLNEVQYVPLLDKVESFLAIRPLAGGPLAERASSVAEALQWPLLHPVVTTIILSINSIDHVDEAIAAAGNITPDPDRFAAMLTAQSTIETSDGH